MDPAPQRVEDLEAAARDRLPAPIWDYLSGGSGTEATLTSNRAVLDAYELLPRVLVDVSATDPGCTLLGRELALPVGIAPMAYHRLLHPEGEVATARAAGVAGALLVVSIFASRTVEEIAAAATGPLWLQLYWLHRREELATLMRRAEDSGFEALVLTVDTPRVAVRLRDRRSGFTLPGDVRAVNVSPSVMAASHAHAGDTSAIERHSAQQFDPSLAWPDLAWIRARTGLPLVLKGILTAADAELAVEHGVEAIVVSNHGGRQLDGAVPSIRALPEIAAAVRGRCQVLVDGGIRRGADVFKALALGADAVLIGRPALWGLTAAGADGVAAVLRMLGDELREVMMLAGRPSVANVGPEAVREVPLS
ncbi:alpha-hydroxy-acid oxidizing protein [Streptomyces sp. KK5PA1]|uniref:Alpha-hydroxy-acid oxidizing protein n=2 Tax=Actinacidiphila acididurans TaxID=2784346 RepID=A0ABS2U5Z7_9ACTN|nr:alpha-hydroxy-acid oxidizing protein [Actinacidiphila acididurans]